MLKMNKQALLASALMVSLVTSACSSTSQPTTGSDNATADKNQQVELSFWVFGSTGYEKLAEEYSKEHPNVTVTFKTAEFADHHSNLFTSLSASSGAPDITMVEVGHIERYREAQDRFYNLYDFGASELKGQYLDWKWQIGESTDGKFLFGLPTDIGPTVMYYRKDVFEAAGLPSTPEEVAGIIKTWDDFEKVGKQIKEKTGKTMTEGPELIYNARRDQAPESYFDTNENLLLESSPHAKKAYDFTVKLIKQGLVGSLTLWTPEWGAAMEEGSYATLLAPSWMQGVIKGNAPKSEGKWGIAPMPEGAGNWGGSYLAIPKESQNAQAAYDFIQWLVSPDNQLKSFTDQGLFPSAPSVYTDAKFTSISDPYFGGINTASAFANAAKEVKNVYAGKNFTLVQGEVVKALQNVQSQKADADAEWKVAIDRAKQQIAAQ